MASIGDYVFLVICLSILGGIVYAVRGSTVNDELKKRQKAMQDKGIRLTSSGLHVKTDRVKLSREDEITNTQASFNKSGDLMKKHKEAFSFNAGKGYVEPPKSK